MLAFAFSSSPDCTHAPAVSSPLVPRSTNIHGSRRHQNHTYMNNKSNKKDPSASTCDSENKPAFDSNGSERPTTSASHENATAKVPFSQRPVKRNPLQTPSNLQTKRRNAYLRKVTNQRDERRFETRGEDMMRLDYIQRQRAWEAERAREAEFVPSNVVEEEDTESELPETNQTERRRWMPEAEVEEFLRDEGKELEALLEYLPISAQDEVMREEDDEFDETSLWSDDADYDALFSEVLSQQEQTGGNATQSSQLMPNLPHCGNAEDEMDMS